ncbi:SGNH/GDSL hydrolase family protein [Pontibacter cellulosilyticus]|uniref:Cellulose-binding protein n=1 Tax=Pontibacter cellulosilyticus TaxID=1720253 RepID=A0A923N8H2_9BACT|nr:SGNH/GDSL hydrolase family protein [Pontibacter cellulosilyticus]MBC5993717.1 cellulose-binding protein [Pontibacter cellulosilyticus]
MSSFFTAPKLALTLALFLFFSQICAASQTPLRIMALGNSITQSNQSNYSYRYNLWKKLLDANLEADFVGSHAENRGGNPNWPQYNGKSFDPDNEGHWGWSADQVLYGNTEEPNKGKLSQWLQNYTPDLVLLHLGTNDMFRNQPLDETLNELREVVRLLRADNPEVTILFAKLIPAYDQKVGPQAANNIVLLNEKIPALVAELNTSTSKVILVDQFTGFNPTTGADTWDGVHPNASGEEKMAQRWFDAIMQVAAPSAVTINGFDASKTEQGHIALEWQTTSEYKSSEFEIERALNSNNFEKIGEVAGAGSSTTLKEYDFTDQNAPYGDLYYRLKHIGEDGKLTYSEVEFVKKEQVLSAADEISMKPELQIYPTATRDKKITMALTGQQPFSEVEIHIYTLSGQRVQRVVKQCTADGSVSMDIHLNNAQKAGLYLVQVLTPTGKLQDEFILE